MNSFRSRFARHLLAFAVVAAAAASAPQPARTAEAARAETKAWVDDDSLFDAPGRTVFTPRRGRTVNLREELARAEAASRTRLAELSARLVAAGPGEAASLAREIAAEKRRGETRLLEIQLKQARALNSAALVTRLERRLQASNQPVKGGR